MVEIRGGIHVLFDLLPDPAAFASTPLGTAAERTTHSSIGSSAAADILCLAVVDEIERGGGAMYRGAVLSYLDPRAGTYIW